MAVENDVSAKFISSLQNPTATKTSSNDALGKDAFLQLLVTQMKNQNPLEPQDNGEFVAQLAQFSSLESMQNLTTTVDGIAGLYQSSQALQASSLVGRSVVVNAGATTVDTAKGMTGSVVVPASSSTTNVKIYDAQMNLVKTVDMGSQSAGTSSFSWDGTNEAGEKVASGNYSFVASGSLDGTATGLATYLPATVNSVTTGVNGGEMMLNLAGGQSIALSKVQTIGI
ncbi:flagellar hook assembly protein FlgD [Pseudomonas syringae group sp. J309-1]|uniref:flagellar hook assembly protein FlgD n=1 Tax=Pseudomonas syringae group sp. J309-1 TaxID=3079588 RepID=UPI00040A05AD|nr:flagellar hook assembly protein FlgD [Pseudomonas syringae group sp. J309-1]MCQ2995498.1 flagellar hook assembly protein FlgD [Pseudomonas syringae]MCQ3032502.1 flagellar hook assembly protein FlgD [Pseudomonas syringae]MDG6401341.1 flagellar hook assembly protein FlgD [Pseudomonas quasicaspiana]MDU8359810.1 flagellar hook assembly protein FlgD [Pseudomonas syringae group sp. J309-1]